MSLRDIAGKGDIVRRRELERFGHIVDDGTIVNIGDDVCQIYIAGVSLEL